MSDRGKVVLCFNLTTNEIAPEIFLHALILSSSVK